MIHIISDTSTLYSRDEAMEAGFDVSPLTVTIGGETFAEFEDISSDRFLNLIAEGNIPTSSQPPIGSVVELYEKYPNDTILNITMADGLSGTYKTAVAAAKMCDNTRNITVINSKTLCGPHRYLVESAIQMVKNGETIETIVDKLSSKIESAKSFLIPADFAYLRRGGRLSSAVSYIGQVTKFAPIMTQSSDGTQIIAVGIKRSFKHAIEHIATILERKYNGQEWKVYVSHAGVRDKAEKALEMLKAKLPNNVFEIIELSPAFITQGGPGCVAIQAICTA